MGGIRVSWETMSLDTARAFFTYLTALIVVVGGFLFLYSTRAEVDAEGLRTIVAGFIGAALQFLFGAQVAQQTKTQVQETSAAATAAQQPPPHT